MIAVVGLRVWRWAVRAGMDRRAAWARQYLVEVIDGGDSPVPRRPARKRAIAAGATRLSGKLRGADRAVLAQWLTDHGLRQRAIEMMRSPFAIRRAQGTRLFVAALSDRETGPLIELLRDRDVRVRAAAARALGECGIDTAVPFLVRAAHSTDTPLPVSLAAMAIIHTAPRTARGLGAAWASEAPAVTAMAADVAGFLYLTDARPALERLISHGDPGVVRSAALALVRIGDPRSADAMAQRLRDRVIPHATRRDLHRAIAAIHGVEVSP